MGTKVKLFIKYLFRFRPPEIIELNYADYIITNKSYFLVSWKSKYAYKLSIKPFYYTYYKSGGSCYIMIAPELESLEIKISNVWQSRKFEVKLHKTEITVPFEFSLASNFNEWLSAKIRLPVPLPFSKKLVIRSTHPKVKNLGITLNRLTFLKPF